MYKINLVDNTDVSKVMQSNTAYYEFMYVIGDFMYMVKNNEPLVIYNFADDTLKYITQAKIDDLFRIIRRYKSYDNSSNVIDSDEIIINVNINDESEKIYIKNVHNEHKLN